MNRTTTVAELLISRVRRRRRSAARGRHGTEYCREPTRRQP